MAPPRARRQLKGGRGSMPWPFFVESALSIQGGPAALARSGLRRHLAEIVALADHHADMANDVVGGRAVELHLQHREMIQVILRLELARLAADRDCNL